MQNPIMLRKTGTRGSTLIEVLMLLCAILVGTVLFLPMLGAAFGKVSDCTAYRLRRIVATEAAGGDPCHTERASPYAQVSSTNFEPSPSGPRLDLSSAPTRASSAVSAAQPAYATTLGLVGDIDAPRSPPGLERLTRRLGETWSETYENLGPGPWLTENRLPWWLGPITAINQQIIAPALTLGDAAIRLPTAIYYSLCDVADEGLTRLGAPHFGNDCKAIPDAFAGSPAHWFGGTTARSTMRLKQLDDKVGITTHNDVAKFEAELAKTAKLSQGLEHSLSRSTATQAKYEAAVEELRQAFIETRSRVSGGVPFPAELIAKVTKVAYYASKRGITNFDAFLSELKVQKFAKGIELEKLTAEKMQALQAAFKVGSEQLTSDAAKTAFSLQVPYKAGARTLTFDEAGKILLDDERLAPRKYDELYNKLGLSHANAGHGPNRSLLDVMNEAKTNKPSYRSGKFTSEQGFIESFAKAKAEYAGHPREQVEFDAMSNVGRTFVRNDLVPTGVTPIPSNTPANVSELAVTKVRAIFRADGTLKTIYPIGAP